MTAQQAIEMLEKGGKLPELAEAIGVVCSDPAMSLDAIMLGLKYPGFVAEQAAFALYKWSFRPLPMDRSLLITDRQMWTEWLRAHRLHDQTGSIVVEGQLLVGAIRDAVREELLSDRERSTSLRARRRSTGPRSKGKNKAPAGRRARKG